MRRSIATLLLALLLPACGSDVDEDEGARSPGLAPRTDASVDVDSQPLSPAAGAVRQRPASMRDTLMIEGAPQVVDFTLVRSPADFAVPFSTYMPATMSVEMDTVGAADQATFTLSDDRAPGDAFMVLAIHPAGTTRLQVEDRVRMVVVSRGPGIDESRTVEPPSWAEWAVAIAYPRSVGDVYEGSAVVGQYGPRFFHVIELYPAENGDVISSRFDAVLEHWRWEDTGRMLQTERTATQ